MCPGLTFHFFYWPGLFSFLLAALGFNSLPRVLNNERFVLPVEEEAQDVANNPRPVKELIIVWPGITSIINQEIHNKEMNEDLLG